MKHLSALFPLILLGAVSCGRAPRVAEQKTPDRGVFEMLALHVQSRMKLSQNCTAGGAVVLQNGKLVYEEYFGTLGRENGSPAVNANARFPFYSVSKGFGASVLASLVSDGTLALDDPVSKYLPHFTGTGPGGKFDRGRVTVRTLASHSSGVPNDDTPPRTWPDSPPFGDIVLQFETGTSFLYSELAMRLLGEVMERASGRTYDQLVAERIAGPLGLATVGYINRGDDLANVVETCVGFDSSRTFYSNEFGARPYPGSGLFGSLRDIAAYAQAWVDSGRVKDGTVFKGDYVPSAWINQPPGRQPDPAYGLLFWLFPEAREVVFSGMAHTICAMLPEEKMVLVMGLNQRNSNRGWDFQLEKVSLARVGYAILASQRSEGTGGQKF